MSNFFYRYSDYSSFQKAFNDTEGEDVVVDLLSSDESLKENEVVEQKHIIRKDNRFSQESSFNKFFGPRKSLNRNFDMKDFSSWKNKNYRDTEKQIGDASKDKVKFSFSDFMNERSGQKTYNDEDRNKDDNQKAINELPSDDPTFKRFSLNDYMRRLEEQTRVKNETRDNEDLIDSIGTITQDVKPDSTQDENFDEGFSNINVEGFVDDADFRGDKYAVDTSELDEMKNRLAEIKAQTEELNELIDEMPEEKASDFNFETNDSSEDIEIFDEENSEIVNDDELAEDFDIQDELLNEEQDELIEDDENLDESETSEEIETAEEETNEQTKTDEESEEETEKSDGKLEVVGGGTKVLSDDDLDGLSSRKVAFGGGVNAGSAGVNSDEGSDVNSNASGKTVGGSIAGGCSGVGVNGNSAGLGAGASATDSGDISEGNGVSTGSGTGSGFGGNGRAAGGDGVLSDKNTDGNAGNGSAQGSTNINIISKTGSADGFNGVVSPEQQEKSQEIIRLIAKNDRERKEIEKQLKQAESDKIVAMKSYESRLKELEKSIIAKDKEAQKRILLEKIKNDNRLTEVRAEFESRETEIRKLEKEAALKMKIGALLKKELKNNLSISNLEMNNKLLEITTLINQEKQKAKANKPKTTKKRKSRRRIDSDIIGGINFD